MNADVNFVPAIDETCYRSYLEALLAGDRRCCANILQEQLQKKQSLKIIYLDLMQRALVEVGSLWERNQISAATEHLASAITESLLGQIYPQLFSQPRRERRAIITCVPQEYHQIGARMVADFFELHGWHGFTLGANTPTGALIRMIRERAPDVVGFSMSILFNRPQLEGMIEAVSKEFPTLQLLLGGRAFHAEEAGWQAREELMQRYRQLRYFDSLNELEIYLTND
jgi:methanogenic corrinoid protein MtbC1